MFKVDRNCSKLLKVDMRNDINSLLKPTFPSKTITVSKGTLLLNCWLIEWFTLHRSTKRTCFPLPVCPLALAAISSCNCQDVPMLWKLWTLKYSPILLHLRRDAISYSAKAKFFKSSWPQYLSQPHMQEGSQTQ